jgi:hypothetical protein
MMSTTKIRTSLYKAARLLGDVNAIEQGKVPRRLVRRVVGKLTGQLFRRRLG